MAKLEKQSKGEAGQYFVVAELFKRGYIAGLTPPGTRGVDVLASTTDGRRPFSIQVKTNGHGRKHWLMGVRSETLEAPDLYYVLVQLGELDEAPSYHIVPSHVVAKFIRENHSEWLRTPGKKGQKHRENNMRVFRDPEGAYLGRWDLLPQED